MPEPVGLELVEAVPSVALAVYAHPDDAEVACGGTLALWAAAGCQVHVVVVTRGDKGTGDPAVVPEALSEQRAREMESAASVLGISGRNSLGYGDGEVEDGIELRRALVAEIRRVRPQVVMCPDPTATFFGQEYVNHRDHRVVGWSAVDAVAPSAALPHYFPECGPQHQVEILYLSGTLQPDVAVDISTTLETKIAALECHRSQIGITSEWLAPLVCRRAEDAGRSAGVAHAETFRRQYLSG